MKVSLIGITTWLVLLVWLVSNAQPEQKVVFLDVGQGDATLLQDGSYQILVDGGPGMKVLEELGEQMAWMDKRLEVIILTHPQEDHMEGLVHILDRYEVGLVIIPRVATDTLLQKEWLNRIQDKGIDWRFAWAGQRITAGDMSVQILAPFEDGAMIRNVNEASVIVRLVYGSEGKEQEELSFLLTGDTERKGENVLLVRTDPVLLDTDILKAGHHGSKTSTSAALVSAVTPRSAVISVGANNKFGHPAQEVLDRLKNMPVWRTDEDGAVKFSYVKDGWVVKSER
jgi:competence protein ComEC